MTYEPGCIESGRPTADPMKSTFWVSITSLPPLGIASRALTDKFINTCST